MSEIMTEGKKAKLIDETVYNDPYVVKSNCLYERSGRSNKTCRLCSHTYFGNHQR